MAGKPTIPESVLRRIRRMRAAGVPRRRIADEIGCSLYTVRKAIDPDFIERERARMREVDARRAPERAADPAYHAYQAAYYSARPERREQVRQSMAALRARRKAEGAER